MSFRGRVSLCWLLLGVFACREQEAVNLVPAPEIVDFFPRRAAAAERVSLRGRYFGTDKDALRLRLGAKSVEIEGELLDTLLRFRVPVGMPIAEVPVYLRRGEKETQATERLLIVAAAENTLVEDETIKLGTLTRDQLGDVLSEADVTFPGVAQFRIFLRYDLDFYVVRYNTSYRGLRQRASALVSMPRGAPSAALIGVCHGTIAKDLRAPSVSLSALSSFDPATISSGEGGLQTVLFAMMASLGYVCVQPDYLGFGASLEVVHPYYHAESLARDVVDALQAAYGLAAEESVSVDGTLYLTGYSQGGHVAMATQRALEASPRQGMHLQMSVVGAGAYDLEGMLSYILSQNTFSNPCYLSYVLHAYRAVEPDFSVSYGLVFKEPYAGLIPTLFDKERSYTELNAMLSVDLRELLTDKFRAQGMRAAEYAPLREALVRNSLLSWTPKARLLLCHGREDEVVPYNNTEITYERLLARAGEGIVELRPLEGDHSSAIVPYAKEMLIAVETQRSASAAQGRPLIQP